MKKPFFSIATLFVAAAISVAVVSCQKDKETENENQTVVKSSNDDAKELLNRIYAFQSLRDDINSGAKSGESMTLDELRDNIDLTFNYEHSQHATPFDYATLDTFYVRMPQTDANGNVSAADAIATYNAFETSLENLLANVEDDSNLAKNFSIKFPETGAKSEDAIEVVFTRGERDLHPSSGPFVKGDDLYWGELLGYYEPRLGERHTDAAVELTKLFRFKPDAAHEGINYLVHNVEYGYYTPLQQALEGFTYYVDSTITCADHWLFLHFGNINEEPWISFEELNCYYYSIKTNVALPGAPLFYSPNNIPFYECVVKDYKYPIYYDEKAQMTRVHKLIVTYANVAYHQ